MALAPAKRSGRTTMSFAMVVLEEREST